MIGPLPLPGELACREVVERVTEYLEGALAPAERTQLELHLVACPDCAAYLRQVRATLLAAGRLSARPLPDEVRTRLREALRRLRRPPA